MISGFFRSVWVPMIFLAELAISSQACGEQTLQQAAPYPMIEIREENRESNVYWDGKLIVELEGNRYLRFRATPVDENWVGTERHKADLCWDYGDSKAKGLQVLGTEHANHPEKGEFALVVHARKPHFDSQIEIVFKGIWMPEAPKFKYSLYTSLQCPLENWYQNSSTAQKSYKANPSSRTNIQVTDYHIEYISMPDRTLSVDHKDPQKYEWFVSSPGGVKSSKMPKIYIPSWLRPGDYAAWSDPANPIRGGGFFGFFDKTHGGWMMRVAGAHFPVAVSLCWMYFGVHLVYKGGVPPRYSTKTLSLDLSLIFEPINANCGQEIVCAATEVDWTNQNAYKLPLFSWGNKFDKLLTDVPGEDTDYHYVWLATRNDYHRDGTTGFDDHYSVTINQQGHPTAPVAWKTTTWCYPYTTQQVNNRRIRFSAMVKTAGCTGPGRLVVIGQDDLISSGKRQYSGKSVTGTTDWTLISMEFIGDEWSSLNLEQNGTGQCWFDNVKIEDLGEAKEKS